MNNLAFQLKRLPRVFTRVHFYCDRLYCDATVSIVKRAKRPWLFKLTSAVLLAGTECIALAAASPHKVASDQAKALLSQAKQQENAGNLNEAIELCLQSLALVEAKNAQAELRKLRKAARAQANAEFDRARAQYAAADYEGSIRSLLNAQDLVGDSRSVAHNLAVANAELNRYEEATAWLNVEIQLSPNEEKVRLGSIQASIIARGSVSAKDAGPAEAWNQKLNKAQLQARDAVTLPGACEALGAFSQAGEASPTLFYDLAQCNLYAGDFGSASKNMETYLKLAPDAVDASAGQQQLRFLKQMAALGGGQAAEVQRQVGMAHLAIQQHRPAIARKALEAADALMPNTPCLKERLAVMAALSGDFSRARELWRQATESEQEPEARVRLQELSSELESRERRFRELLAKSRNQMRELLSHFVVDGEPPSFTYASERLSEADSQLGAAASIAPFAPELHLLYVFSMLQRNDMSGALESMQILDAAEVPVGFYGWIYTKAIKDETDKDRKPRELARIEFDNGFLRLTDLVFCNLKKHRSTPTLNSPGADPLSDFGLAKSTAAKGSSATIQVAGDQLKKIETKDEFVYIQIDAKGVKHKKLLIEPVQLATEVPLKGPGARRYANQYTTMLSERLQLDGARLGKESMTLGEKFQMAKRFALLAYDIYGAVAFPLGAYSAIYDARNLNRYMSTMRAHATGRRPSQIAAGLDARLRPLPIDSLKPVFVEPDKGDVLSKK